MKFGEYLESLSQLLEESPVEKITDGKRYVVLSDLHMGDGGARDDLAHNRKLLIAALERRYLAQGYVIVVNGDAEELQKFRLPQIRRAWPDLYAIFDEFERRGRLRKLVGNHDISLLEETNYPYPLLSALRLMYGSRTLFVFHGHQASRFFTEYNFVAHLFVRYIVKTIRYRNTSVSEDSRQRFNTERRIYHASKRLRIVSITGHTHRPLFESLSKYDSLRWSIETLAREYTGATAERRTEIAETVRLYRRELGHLSRQEMKEGFSQGIYERRGLLIPCMFNSGCATGKQGITMLEIANGEISLVYWAGDRGIKTYIARESIDRIETDGTPSAAYVLGRDSIDYLFARIDLLGGEPPLTEQGAGRGNEGAPAMRRVRRLLPRSRRHRGQRRDQPPRMSRFGEAPPPP